MKDAIRSFIVQELLDGKSVADSEDLLLSGLLDSLGVMRLVAFLEMDLETSVPPEDVTIENFSSIDTLGAYIEQRVGSATEPQPCPKGAEA
jgi:acyl carrier protein